MSDHEKESVNLLKRKFLKAAAAGAAFTVPFMASFSKEGLRANLAYANHGGGHKKKPGKKNRPSWGKKGGKSAEKKKKK